MYWRLLQRSGDKSQKLARWSRWATAAGRQRLALLDLRGVSAVPIHEVVNRGIISKAFEDERNRQSSAPENPITVVLFRV
jgi:hypothetical protein